MLKLQDIKFNTLKLIYLFALQGSITIKNQRYFLWQMNLLTCIIPQVNTTHYGIKFLRYNGPVIWNDFF